MANAGMAKQTRKINTTPRSLRSHAVQTRERKDFMAMPLSDTTGARGTMVRLAGRARKQRPATMVLLERTTSNKYDLVRPPPI
jgi:hypothetical protein